MGKKELLVDIVITAIHCEVSDAVKDYAREKVDRLEKYFDRARKISVNIHAEQGRNEVELICTAGRGHVLTVHVTSEESVREAIDLAVDKMGTQLRKLKDKVRGHKGRDNRKKLVRDIRKITMRLNQLAELDDESGRLPAVGLDDDGDDTYEDAKDDE